MAKHQVNNHISQQCDDDAIHGYTAKNHKRHYVQHDYHDHADDINTDVTATTIQGEQIQIAVPDSSSFDVDQIRKTTNSNKENLLSSGSSGVGKDGKTRGGVNVPFPEKLHQMLDKIEQDGFGSIISWQPHGRAFAVHKQKEFVDVIMPRYFRQSKISSFQRQLNLYGFCRLTRGRDKGAYYHELFLRGRIFLCRQMIRTRIKGTGIKASSSPDSEPNFYSMKPCFSDPNASLASIPWAMDSSVIVAGTATGAAGQPSVCQSVLPQGGGVSLVQQSRPLDFPSSQSPVSLSGDWSLLASAMEHPAQQGGGGPLSSNATCASSSRVSPQLSVNAIQGNSPLQDLVSTSDVAASGDPQVVQFMAMNNNKEEIPPAKQACLPGGNIPVPMSENSVVAPAVLPSVVQGVKINKNLSSAVSITGASFPHSNSSDAVASRDLHLNSLSALSDSLNGGSQITSRLLDPIILRRIQATTGAATSKSRPVLQGQESLSKRQASNDNDCMGSTRDSPLARFVSDSDPKNPRIGEVDPTDPTKEQRDSMQSPRTSATFIGQEEDDDEIDLGDGDGISPSSINRKSNSSSSSAARRSNVIAIGEDDDDDVIEEDALVDELVRTASGSAASSRQQHERLEISRTLRQLSFMNLEDMTYQNAERLDEQAMDDFFMDFEDTEMSALLAAIQRHDNDEVLGDALDHLMDSL